ncbi:AP1-like basic-leucine zipper transcription factor [Trichoderma reesei QM6a]|uniref:BZIP domain-containing protein n=2 Tax=Hypocrea jecorina TaxID=51453 RepID=A0A024S361_HYPJR
MEYINALTADKQQSADTQIGDDRSSSEPTSKEPTIPKVPTEAPPKLKTSERRRIQNRQAQKTYREKQKRRLQALESLAKSKTLAKDAPASGTPGATIGQDMAGILAADSPIMVGLSGVMQPQELGPAAGLGMGSLVGCGTTFNATALSYQTGAPAPMYRYTPNLDFHQADTTLNSGRSFREDLFSASNPLVAQSGSIAFSPGGDLDSPSLQQVAPSHTIAQDGQLAERDDTDSLLAQFLLQDDTALSTSLLANIRKNKITLKDVIRKGLQSLERDSHNTTNPAESSMQGRVIYKQMQGESKG